MKKRSQPSQPSTLATPAELEQILGHTFARPELLTLALTHRSFVYDAANTPGARTSEALADPTRDNEQLEFVGDAALGLLAAEGLYRRFPTCREGELTRLRASIVSRKYLGAVGDRLDLGRWLRLGLTAENNGSRQSAALFANAVEAIIAALYLDGGLEAARHFVDLHVLTPALPELERSLSGKDTLSGAVGDHKSALQEMLQASGIGRPDYRLISETGPDHRRIFRIQVVLDPNPGTPQPEALQGVIGEAEGPSKKQAQQEAARLAVARIRSLTAAPSPEPEHA